MKTPRLLAFILYVMGACVYPFYRNLPALDLCGIADPINFLNEISSKKHVEGHMYLLLTQAGCGR
jgi:hypothetical protein